VVIGEPRSERDAELTPSRKVVMEKLFDGEEMIIVTIRGSTTGSRIGKAEGSTSAQNDGNQESNATNKRQAVRPPRWIRSGNIAS
jgi:L-cysteine desulfidase